MPAGLTSKPLTYNLGPPLRFGWDWHILACDLVQLAFSDRLIPDLQDSSSQACRTVGLRSFDSSCQTQADLVSAGHPCEDDSGNFVRTCEGQ